MKITDHRLGFGVSVFFFFLGGGVVAAAWSIRVQARVPEIKVGRALKQPGCWPGFGV